MTVDHIGQGHLVFLDGAYTPTCLYLSLYIYTYNLDLGLLKAPPPPPSPLVRLLICEYMFQVGGAPRGACG